MRCKVLEFPVAGRVMTEEKHNVTLLEKSDQYVKAYYPMLCHLQFVP